MFFFPKPTRSRLWVRRLIPFPFHLSAPSGALEGGPANFAPEGAREKKGETISRPPVHRRERLGLGKGTYADVYVIAEPKKACAETYGAALGFDVCCIAGLKGIPRRSDTEGTCQNGRIIVIQRACNAPRARSPVACSRLSHRPLESSFLSHLTSRLYQ
jgi:hypothetical protein